MVASGAIGDDIDADVEGVVVASLELLMALELLVELAIKELPLSIGPNIHVSSCR